MKTINELKHLYFLGIGGIGMSALARLFLRKGVKVSGYDRTPSPLTDQLREEGCEIWFDDDPALLPEEIDMVVLTPAIPSNHRGLLSLRHQPVPILKRAELLGVITREAKTVAVAGTHGKTTTSSMAAHLLYQSSPGCTAILGGVASNYQSNLLLPDKPSPWMVTEADEYDRSFLHLSPLIATITATDADHLDIYGTHEALLESFQQFIGKIRPGGYLIKKIGLPLAAADSEITEFTYALNNPAADCFATHIVSEGIRYRFDLVMPGRTIEGLLTGIPALVNVENAVAACTMAALAGCSDDEIRSNLATFTGIRRRFDIRVLSADEVYIDDYAHHPEEINALITSVRHLFPSKKITAIFQPHLYTRTRDFATGFAGALDQCDECVLLDIYPARELPIEGVDSGMVAALMKRKATLTDKKALLKWIENHRFEVLLTIGAGDIDRLVPPIEALIKNRKETRDE